MIPLEEARAHVLDRVHGPLESERVAIADAVGRVAASDVVAEEAVPPFANSAMDGYAVRAVDVAGAPVVLREVATTLAGQGPSGVLLPGEAVRIMTGAPVPGGADAIVPVERIELVDGGVRIGAAAPSGQHVRGVGEDVQPGDVVLRQGDAQTAQAGTAVSRVPEVTVRDANQNLLLGIPVVFTVESGGGSVVNGNQITNWAGSAGPSGWIMGSAGPQVLRVTVEGVEPVFFTATSLDRPKSIHDAPSH